MFIFDKEHQKQIESGRSLIEMIGVMSIITILSIVGVQYYDVVHVKLHTNDIMENIYKRAATSEGSAHSKNLLEKYHQTAYHYGIRVPQVLCRRMMIPVGEVETGKDRPLTASVCKAVINRINSEKTLGKVYNKDCVSIDSLNLDVFCADAKVFYIDAGSAKKVVRTKAQQDALNKLKEENEAKGIPNNCEQPVEYYTDCEDYQYVDEDGCCHDCDSLHKMKRDDNNQCVYCFNVDPGWCCNPKNGELKIFTPNTQCCNPATGQVASIGWCQKCEGGIVSNYTETNKVSGVFKPECPQNSYIEINPSDNTNGCCKPCPNGKITNASNTVGIENCVIPSSSPACPNGSFLVTDASKNGLFTQQCPQNSYIDIDPTDEYQGCCKSCPEGKITNGPNAIGEEQCIDEVKNCLNNYLLEDTNGNCYPCDFPRYLNLAKINGKKLNGQQLCSEWEKHERLEERGLSVLPCPPETPLRDKDGNCYSCDTLDQVNVKGVEDYCKVCNGQNGNHLRNLSSYNNTTKNELKLPDGKGSFCNFDCPPGEFLGTNGCFSCDDAAEVDTGSDYTEAKKKCETCNVDEKGSRRRKRQYSRVEGCTLSTCPEDTPLMDKDGNCYTCDHTESLNLGRTTTGNCKNKCPNRVEIVSSDNIMYCALPCTPAKPLMNKYGRCFSCDEKDWYSSALDIEKTTLSCERICSNRETISGYCIPKCPTDKPLLDNGFFSSKNSLDTYCHSCDEDKPIELAINSEECGKRCPTRKLVGSYCVKNKCPDDKPLMDKDGKCYACDDTTIIHSLDKTSCDNCKNREFISSLEKDNLCVLKCPKDKPLMLSSITTENYCASCDDPQDVLALKNSEDCETFCKGKRVTSGTSCEKCPPQKPIIIDSHCYSCDEPTKIPCNNDECRNALSVCDGTSNTKRIFGTGEKDTDGVMWEEGYSYSCLGRPLTDTNGRCQRCDYTGEITDQNNETLTLCPKQRYIRNQLSYLCPTTSRSLQMLNQTECTQCNYKWNKTKDICVLTTVDACEGRPLLNQQGQCLPCNYSGSIPLESNEDTLKLCSKQRYISGNFSYPCPTKAENLNQLDAIQCNQCNAEWNEESGVCQFSQTEQDEQE